MRLIFLASAVSLGLLSACATAPRAPAATLANTGQSATAAFAAQLNNLRSSIRGSAALSDFHSTYESCIQQADTCEILAEPDEIDLAIGGPDDTAAEDASSESQQEDAEQELDDLAASLPARRRQMSNAILLRSRALTALSGAYGALRREADYDAAGDLGGALSELWTSSTALLANVNPEASVVGEAFTPLVKQAGGFFADRAQTERLHQASGWIRRSLEAQLDALRIESIVFESLTEGLGERESAVRAQLLAAGASPLTPSLRRVAGDVNLELGANPEALLANNRALRTAVLAADAANARECVRDATFSYHVMQEAMEYLISAHREFEAGGDMNIARVDMAMEVLQAQTSTGCGGVAAPIERAAPSQPATPAPAGER